MSNLSIFNYIPYDIRCSEAAATVIICLSIVLTATLIAKGVQVFKAYLTDGLILSCMYWILSAVIVCGMIFLWALMSLTCCAFNRYAATINLCGITVVFFIAMLVLLWSSGSFSKIANVTIYCLIITIFLFSVYAHYCTIDYTRVYEITDVNIVNIQMYRNQTKPIFSILGPSTNLVMASIACICLQHSKHKSDIQLYILTGIVIFISSLIHIFDGMFGLYLSDNLLRIYIWLSRCAFTLNCIFFICLVRILALLGNIILRNLLIEYDICDTYARKLKTAIENKDDARCDKVLKLARLAFEKEDVYMPLTAVVSGAVSFKTWHKCIQLYQKVLWCPGKY